MFGLHRFSLLVLWRGLTFLDLGDLLAKGFNLTLFYFDHFFYSHCWLNFLMVFSQDALEQGTLVVDMTSVCLNSPRCANTVTRYLAFSSFVLILLHIKEISWILFSKFNNDLNSWNFLKMRSSENCTYEYCRSQRRTRWIWLKTPQFFHIRKRVVRGVVVVEPAVQ